MKPIWRKRGVQWRKYDQFSRALILSVSLSAWLTKINQKSDQLLEVYSLLLQYYRLQYTFASSVLAYSIEIILFKPHYSKEISQKIKLYIISPKITLTLRSAWIGPGSTMNLMYGRTLMNMLIWEWHKMNINGWKIKLGFPFHKEQKSDSNWFHANNLDWMLILPMTFWVSQLNTFVLRK